MIDKRIYFLSFLVPLAVRSIPELLSPTPIGFDTVIYLVQAKNLSSSSMIMPFFARILGILYSIGIDLMMFMKILPTLFFATTVFLACMYAYKKLCWSMRRTLFLIIAMTFSAAMLRISWDLHRQSVATLLLLAYLCMDPWNNLTIKKAIASFILVAFIGLLHELALATAITMNLYLALSALRTKRFRNTFFFIMLAATPFICYEIGSYISYSRLVNLYTVFGNLLYEWGPGGYADIVSHAVGILVATFWYILPLVPLGFFHDKYLTPWVIVMAVGYLSQILTPFFAVRYADRCMLYMTVPLTFYATNAISKFNGSRLFKTLATIVTLMIVSINGFSMLGVTQPFKLPSVLYTGFIPSTMVFSTAKPEHIVAVISFSEIINNIGVEGACVVTHDPWFKYWVIYLTNAEVYSFSDNNPSLAILDAMQSSCRDIYLIWFEGAINNAEMLSVENKLALYRIPLDKTLNR